MKDECRIGAARAARRSDHGGFPDAPRPPSASGLLICGILTWSEFRSFSLACDRVDKLQPGAGIGEPACRPVGGSNARGTNQGY